MRKTPAATTSARLRQINSRLLEQARDIDDLRASLAIQLTRIAEIQVQLDRVAAVGRQRYSRSSAASRAGDGRAVRITKLQAWADERAVTRHPQGDGQSQALATVTRS